MGNIHYSAPDEAKILEFATRSLHHHSERHEDQVYTQAEIVYGFAEFLKVMLRIEAKFPRHLKPKSTEVYLRYP